MPVTVRAVLFDLDGTLVDSFAAICASVNHVRALHGLQPLSLQEVKGAVGNGVVRLLELTCSSSDPNADAERFIAHNAETLTQGTKVLPGVRRTLSGLTQRGVKLAVCSNKPVQLSRQLLKDFKLERYFDVILGPESVPQRKPAPDMLLAAIRRLGVDKSESVYIGDMTIDIETARSGGIPVWVIPSGSQDERMLKASKPDRILRQFRELLDILRWEASRLPNESKEL